MCLNRALDLYCSSPCNRRMKDVAEKCDQGAEQEPNISTDIYSDHICGGWSLWPHIENQYKQRKKFYTLYPILLYFYTLNT